MQPAVNMPKIADIGDVVAGKYRIDALLGQGGMGAVFVATHQITGKRFAIKMLLPHVARDATVAQRFVQEAQASARIAHRNVVEVLDVGEWNGALYLVMELLVGEPLTNYIERNAPIPVPEVMALMTRVLRGLEAAHVNGIIHRDLKPDNIFLCGDDSGEPLEPKIVDFGIAKVTDSGAPRGTATGTGMGTAFYMPLEQMMGAKHVTEAADIYSIATVMYECLTGKLPYEAETLPALVMQMHSETPADISSLRPELPPALGAAIMRALSTKAAERPQTVAEFAASLRPFGMGDMSLPLPRPRISKLPTAGSTSGMSSGEVLASMAAGGAASAPTMQAGAMPLASEIRVKASAEAPAPKGNRVLVPVLATVGIAAIGGLVAVFAMKSTTAAPPPPVVVPPIPQVQAAAAAEPAVVAAAPSYRVTVRTGSRTARVLSAGLELGTTPTEVELQGTAVERTFDLVADAAEPMSWTIRVRDDGAIEASSGDVRRQLAVTSDRRATLDVELPEASSGSSSSRHGRTSGSVPAPVAAAAPTPAPAPAPVAAPEPPPAPAAPRAPALAPR